MRQLLLLRHAKSSQNDPTLPDHARPLSPRGERAAVAMAAEMRRLGLRPDVVLVSTSRRTMQTLAAFEPWDALPQTNSTDALYLAPAEDMLDILRLVSPDARCVLVVGHNPGLHELAMLLAGAEDGAAQPHIRRMAEGYPSGSLTEFSLLASWHELRADTAQLMRFVRPSDLSEASL